MKEKIEYQKTRISVNYQYSSNINNTINEVVIFGKINLKFKFLKK